MFRKQTAHTKPKKLEKEREASASAVRLSHLCCLVGAVQSDGRCGARTTAAVASREPPRSASIVVRASAASPPFSMAASDSSFAVGGDGCPLHTPARDYEVAHQGVKAER